MSGASASSSSSNHLVYPTPNAPALSSASASTSTQPTQKTVTQPTQKPQQQQQHRLYVGNLAPSVDDYTLAQVFGRYGRLARMDLLFHRSGPLKGRPRGYAFVEFVDKEDAAKALLDAHDRLVRGRKIVVTLASNAPPQPDSSTTPHAHRRALGAASTPTTLSLLKTPSKRVSTDAKIAALEAKLNQMQRSSKTEHEHAHASLPPKPFGATLLAKDVPGAEKGQPMVPLNAKSKR